MNNVLEGFFLARMGAFFNKWADRFITGAIVSSQMLSPYEPEAVPVPTSTQTLEDHPIPTDTDSSAPAARIVPFIVSNWKLVNSKGDLVAPQAVMVSKDVFLHVEDAQRGVNGRSNRVIYANLSSNALWTQSPTGDIAVFIIGRAHDAYIAFLNGTQPAAYHIVGGVPIYRHQNQGGVN